MSAPSTEPSATAPGPGVAVPSRVLVLLGAPGAGKGTQAQVLGRRLGLLQVATGDLFRAAVQQGTPLGRTVRGYMDRGELVPDAVTVDMLFERLGRPDAAAGVLLDGFPRTAAQAEALDASLAERGGAVQVAPYIDVPEDELAARLGGRWICRAAGHPYHEQTKPPLVPGVCDIDGSELYQRDDDRPETVRARLRQQLGELEKVLDHYRGRGVLITVDGRGTIEDVSRRLLAAVGPIVERQD